MPSYFSPVDPARFIVIIVIIVIVIIVLIIIIITFISKCIFIASISVITRSFPRKREWKLP